MSADLLVGRLPAGLKALPVMLRDGSVAIVVQEGLTDEEAAPAIEKARQVARDMAARPRPSRD